MNLNKMVLFNIYNNIKKLFPAYVIQAITKLLPISFLLSVFEIFGLITLLPVINIIIEPSLIVKNKYLHFLYSSVGFNSYLPFVLFLLAIVTVIFILKNTLIYWVSAKQSDISFNIASRLAIFRYQSYLDKSYQFHIDNNSASLLRNIIIISFDFVTGIMLPFIIIINEILIIILIIIGILYYDSVLFLCIVALVLPFFIFYITLYKNKLNVISSEKDAGNKAMYKNGMQSMEAFREMVLFEKKDYFKPIFENSTKRYSDALSILYQLNNFSPKIIELITVISIFGIFLIGYYLDRNISLLASFLVLFALAAYRLIPSLNKIIYAYNNIKASYYVFDYFKEKSEEDHSIPTSNLSSTNQPLTFKNEIEIKNLSFKYLNTQTYVLNNLNLIIKKGQTIGIIGPSGSGKTTLLNILLRLFKESNGGIYVDERRIDEKTIGGWYKLVSYVPQNVTILDGNITENICFGLPQEEIDFQHLKAVIDMAQLSDFILELPNGLNTQIGEKGVKISGGQRQRLGIARALYHNGQLLIFDEATSSLDMETEKMLTESINNLSHKELTIIIVAHRLQTLKYCDKIYKLENGKLSSPLSYNEIQYS